MVANIGLFPPWLALSVLVAANCTTGAVWLWRTIPSFYPVRPARSADFVGQLAASFGVGALINGWLALVLAEFGRFTLPALVICWLAAVALGAWRTRGRPPIVPSTSPDDHVPWLHLAVLLWLPVAGWLFLRPHQFVKGGADAGVYVNVAANIAHTGALIIQDDTLATLDERLYPALLRALPEANTTPYIVLPGFYVPDTSGEVIPQFYALHPVWQATAHALGGLDANLMVTGVWALFGTLALAVIARDLTDWRGGLLMLAAVTIFGPQIWFARYPTTEPLTQFLLWLGLWALVRWLASREAAATWALVAGVALGQTLLARIDMFFLLALPVGLWAWHGLSGAERSVSRRSLMIFSAALGGMALHAFAHGALWSTPYFLDTYGYALRLLLQRWWIPLLLLVAGAVLLVVGVRLASQRRTLRQATMARVRQPAAVTVIVLLLALALWAWFIRPNAPSTLSPDWFGGGDWLRTDDENFRRLAWYLSPVGVWAGVAGACWMVWRLDRRLVVPLAVGLGFTVLYIWRIQANPKHIYAMRRYLPAVFPFFLIAATYLITQIAPATVAKQQRWRWAAAALLAAMWLGGLGWAARGFVTHVDDVGLPEQIAALSATLSPHAVLLFDETATVGQGDTLGTPLQFLHGHSVFVLRERAELDEAALANQIDRWQRDGRAVYWVALGDSAEWPLSLPLTEQTQYAIEHKTLEEPVDRKPTTVEDRVWRGVVYLISPSS